MDIREHIPHIDEPIHVVVLNNLRETSPRNHAHICQCRTRVDARTAAGSAQRNT
jgi:hypothetical protein